MSLRVAVVEPNFRKSTVREYFESIVIAVILALFIRTFVVQAFKIPTGSMENNLLIGDHLLVNKFVFGPTPTSGERALHARGHRPGRDDVLVFKYPEEPDRDFIKRVIGLPGETLEVREKKVYINGTPLDEPYVPHSTWTRARRASRRWRRAMCAAITSGRSPCRRISTS